MRGTAEEGGRP